VDAEILRFAQDDGVWRWGEKELESGAGVGVGREAGGRQDGESVGSRGRGNVG
jgi:hypothetical protein